MKIMLILNRSESIVTDCASVLVQAVSITRFSHPRKLPVLMWRLSKTWCVLAGIVSLAS